MSEAALSRALALLAEWRDARRADAAAGVHEAAIGAARRRVIERIARIVRRAAYHRRPGVVLLAGQARRAALLPFGAGGERVLGELAAAEMPDDVWLRAVGAFGEAQARGGCGSEPNGASPGEEDSTLCALLLLQSDG